MVVSPIQKLYDTCKEVFASCSPGIVPSSENIDKLRSVLDEITMDAIGLSSDMPYFRALGKRRTPPITYLHLHECDKFSMGIFCLPPSGVIPLHNHPGMTAFIADGIQNLKKEKKILNLGYPDLKKEKKMKESRKDSTREKKFESGLPRFEEGEEDEGEKERFDKRKKRGGGEDEDDSEKIKDKLFFSRKLHKYPVHGWFNFEVGPNEIHVSALLTPLGERVVLPAFGYAKGSLDPFSTTRANLSPIFHPKGKIEPSPK